MPTTTTLIAGSTAFDDAAAALLAVLAEWASGRDFATRISNIGGTGSGPRLNGDVFLRADDPVATRVTVFDDESSDNLTGESGQNWLLVNPDQDRGERLQSEASHHGDEEEEIVTS